MKPNAGRVTIDESILLDFLDFRGGTIIAVTQKDYGRIELVIEHPDMPSVKEFASIPNVKPLMSRTEDSVGRYIVTRIEPAKVH